MRQIISKLWNDDCGAIIATEWVFVVTILVLGIITGLVALRQAVISETTELAQAIMALNQSYSFSGQYNCESSTAGSCATDTCNTISESSSAAACCNSVSQLPCD